MIIFGRVNKTTTNKTWIKTGPDISNHIPFTPKKHERKFNPPTINFQGICLKLLFFTKTLNAFVLRGFCISDPPQVPPALSRSNKFNKFRQWSMALSCWDEGIRLFGELKAQGLAPNPMGKSQKSFPGRRPSSKCWDFSMTNFPGTWNIQKLVVVSVGWVQIYTWKVVA